MSPLGVRLNKLERTVPAPERNRGASFASLPLRVTKQACKDCWKQRAMTPTTGIWRSSNPLSPQRGRNCGQGRPTYSTDSRSTIWQIGPRAALMKMSGGAPSSMARQSPRTLSRRIRTGARSGVSTGITLAAGSTHFKRMGRISTGRRATPRPALGKQAGGGAARRFVGCRKAGLVLASRWLAACPRAAG